MYECARGSSRRPVMKVFAMLEARNQVKDAPCLTYPSSAIACHRRRDARASVEAAARRLRPPSESRRVHYYCALIAQPCTAGSFVPCVFC